MPALIQNTKKSEASARLKKFNSIMSQAVLMSENDNGNAKTWAKEDLIEKDPDNPVYDDADAENSEIYFNNYLKPYLKYLNTTKDEKTNLFKVYMNDNSTFILRNGNCIDFIFDYNGDTAPNEEGRDRFRFLICPENETALKDNRSFYPYHYTTSTTKEQRLQDCKSHPAYCSGFLEMENWEFTKDYPYRL